MKKAEKKDCLIDNDNYLLTNDKIIDFYVKNGLIETCMMYQFAKLGRREAWKLQYSGDLINDIVVIMAEYPNDKLNNIHQNNHMNAWLTRIIQNNIYSNHSKFYTDYLRFNMKTEEIAKKHSHLLIQE